MSGLSKTRDRIKDRKKRSFKTLVNPLHGDFRDSQANPVGVQEDALKDITGAFTPEVPVPEEDTIIPIPDERRSALSAKKRRAKSKRSGRDSTILTEGLGG